MAAATEGPRLLSDWLALWGLGPAAGGAAAAGQPGGAAAGFAAFASGIEAALRDGTSGPLGPRLAALLRKGAWTLPGFDAFADGPLRALSGRAGNTLRENLDTMLGWADEWLALPPVGPQREWIAAGQRVQRALIAEQRARLVLAELCEQALEAAKARFADALESEEGSPVTSVRGLYDLWITHAEEAWTRTLADDAFVRAFGAWVDAGSASRVALRDGVQRLTGPAGLVQREDLERVLERERALRRELEHLRDEVAALRAAAAEKPARAPEQAAAAPPRQRAAKKKAPKGAAQPAPATKTTRPRRKRKPAAKPPRAEFDIGDILAGRD